MGSVLAQNPSDWGSRKRPNSSGCTHLVFGYTLNDSSLGQSSRVRLYFPWAEGRDERAEAKRHEALILGYTEREKEERKRERESEKVRERKEEEREREREERHKLKGELELNNSAVQDSDAAKMGSWGNGLGSPSGWRLCTT